MAKDSHLTNYLEVHSFNSIKNFFKVQWMDFEKFSLLLNCIIAYFIYLGSKVAIGLAELFQFSFQLLLHALIGHVIGSGHKDMK